MSAYTEEEFLEVIAAKGGALEALDCGLKWSQCETGDLRVDWMVLSDKWDEFRQALEQFEDDYEIEPM